MKTISLLFLAFAYSVESWSQCTMDPLPSPTGETVQVGTMVELRNALNSANDSGGNVTILIENGTYYLDNTLHVTADHVTFRSLSGNRDDVKLWGEGMTGGIFQVFLVAGSYFTCADLTLGRVAYHGIQVQGEVDADYPLIHNVRFEDTYEQMLKVSYNSGSGIGSDFGVVEWCHFEYTAGIGPQFYIGGVDAHHASNWEVHHNTFVGIRSPEADLAEHAIHFWSQSEQTFVHHNRITNCDRGIGFGLGSSGHVGGTISNNMVHTTRDIAIGLESSTGTEVYNNTVFTENYFNSIEYRFSATHDVHIANNLTNEAIASRDGGSGTLEANISTSQESWFEDPTQGDLHLVSEEPLVIDMGITLPGIDSDFDCDQRPMGDGVDIGADEFGCAPTGSSWGACISTWNQASTIYNVMPPSARVSLLDLLYWYSCFSSF